MGHLKNILILPTSNAPKSVTGKVAQMFPKVGQNSRFYLKVTVLKIA